MKRRVDGFKTPTGIVFNAWPQATTKIAFWRGVLAHGQGSPCGYGDSYYSKPTYSRIDIIYTPFSYKNIEGNLWPAFILPPIYFNDNPGSVRIKDLLWFGKVLKRFKGDRHTTRPSIAEGPDNSVTELAL